MTKVYNKTSMLDRRRELRQSATQAEDILWAHLRRNQREGIKFKRQYSVDGFVIDFYAPSVKLAIEVDGASHDQEFAAGRDRVRQHFIEQYGVQFLRFKDEDVLFRTLNVISRIDAHIKALSPSPYQGEGLGERSTGFGEQLGQGLED